MNIKYSEEIKEEAKTVRDLNKILTLSGIKEDVVIIGEVGLTGEVRSVNMIEKRLKEAEKLGIKRCIIPQNNKKLLKDSYKLDIIGVRNINEGLKSIGII